MDELEFLKKYRSFLITSHLSPDGDAIGSEIALCLFLKETGKKAIIVNDEPVPGNYRFLAGSEIIQTIKDFKHRSHKKEPFEAAILLECSGKNRAGQTGKLVGKKPILNIDHHFDNTLYGDANLVRFKVSACGEIIYDLIRKARGTITEEIASALYTAVLTDTSSFRFHARTRTFRIVADLTDKKADPDRIFEKVYEQVSFPALLLLGKSLSTITQALGGLVTYCRVDRNMYRETGTSESDSESFIDYLRVIEGSKITFILKELPNGKTRVNLRSKDNYDVQQIAAGFGGGGHLNAAGCTISAGPEESSHLVLTAIEKILTKPL